MALLAGACTQKPKEQSPPRTGRTETAAPQIQIPTGPEWSVSWLSQCQDTETPCLGSAGFQILADGSFQVGPASNGQIYRGELSVTERKELAELFTSLRDDTASLASVTESCANTELAESWITNGNVQSIKLSFDFFGNTREVQLNQNSFCGSITALQTEKLTQKLSELLVTYHPSVFPDECLERAQEVEAAYDTLRSCEKDQDCSWLDSTFHPINETELQFVVTDSCTKLRPLFSANTARVTEEIIESLQAARAQLYETCGSSIARVDCDGVMGFESSVIRPVCDLGKCKLPQLSDEQPLLRGRMRINSAR
jgi:hypothetical protein